MSLTANFYFCPWSRGLGESFFTGVVVYVWLTTSGENMRRISCQDMPVRQCLQSQEFKLYILYIFRLSTMMNVWLPEGDFAWDMAQLLQYIIRSYTIATYLVLYAAQSYLYAPRCLSINYFLIKLVYEFLRSYPTKSWLWKCIVVY